MNILTELDSKFSANLNAFLSKNETECKTIDLRARAIAAIGEIVSEKACSQPSHIEISLIFDEVFSDMILSVYFTGCALDKPAHTVLRRALELGIAIVYLWDLPHAFWGWKSHDSDLNFNEMIEHLAKDSYKSFLSSLNPTYAATNTFDYSKARRQYRILSNTIHGKISTHESKLPDRFSHNPQDVITNLDLISEIQTNLLYLFRMRFSACFAEMESKIPSISTLI